MYGWLRVVIFVWVLLTVVVQLCHFTYYLCIHCVMVNIYSETMGLRRQLRVCVVCTLMPQLFLPLPSELDQMLWTKWSTIGLHPACANFNKCWQRPASGESMHAPHRKTVSTSTSTVRATCLRTARWSDAILVKDGIILCTGHKTGVNGYKCTIEVWPVLVCLFRLLSVLKELRE